MSVKGVLELSFTNVCSILTNGNPEYAWTLNIDLRSRCPSFERWLPSILITQWRGPESSISMVSGDVLVETYWLASDPLTTIFEFDIYSDPSRDIRANGPNLCLSKIIFNRPVSTVNKSVFSVTDRGVSKLFLETSFPYSSVYTCSDLSAASA